LPSTTPTRALAGDVLLGRTTLARGLLRTDTIRSRLPGEGSPYPRQGGKLWLVLTLERWLRSYVD
jgi:asparagine synthase (glutamine-hydrolysing)